MLRLAAFLQLFHFWQADKAGFMWHRKKAVCTFAASAQKCSRQTRALTDYPVCKKDLTEGQNFNNAIPLRTFWGSVNPEIV